MDGMMMLAFSRSVKRNRRSAVRTLSSVSFRRQRGRGNRNDDDDGSYGRREGRGGRYGDNEPRGPPKVTGMEAPPHSVVWDHRIHDPRVLKMGYVLDSTKWEIYKLHEEYPDKWTVASLARKFQLPETRIQAVITLKRRLVELREAGEDYLPNLTKEFERMAENHLKQLSIHHGFRIENSHHRETPQDAKQDLNRLEMRSITLHDGDDEDAVLAYFKKKGELLKEKEVADKAQAAAVSMTQDEALPETKLDFPDPSQLKPKQKQKKKPRKTGLFAVKDISKRNEPTRIVSTDYTIKLASPQQELRRSWTPKPRFVDTLDIAPQRKLDNPIASDSNFGVYYPFPKPGPPDWPFGSNPNLSPDSSTTPPQASDTPTSS